jgi:hypothetical protein
VALERTIADEARDDDIQWLLLQFADWLQVATLLCFSSEGNVSWWQLPDLGWLALVL